MAQWRTYENVSIQLNRQAGQREHAMCNVKVIAKMVTGIYEDDADKRI